MTDTGLYPMKFQPILKEKIWGGDKLKAMLGKESDKPNIGESWEISGVDENVSVLQNGFLAGNSLEELIEIYMGDLVGEEIFDNFGVEFPLLIKFIDANDVLSIQVHPDDKLAKELHNAFGKTEMWYIIQADKNAEIITGFNKKTEKKTYLENLNNNTIKEILNIETANAGDAFFIPAGRIHAIGAGVLLAEIQQTSDITYRIYDWDRKDDDGKSRELHTNFALDAIDFKYYENYKTDYKTELNKTSSIIDSNYFTTNIFQFDQIIEKDYYYLDSFVIYMCVDGSCTVSHKKNSEVLKKGDCILIPASLNSIRLTPDEETKLLEIFIKPNKQK